jgi:hypothetical protein
MKTISLDIIVGHFLPSSFGWAFLFFVLIAEGILLSKYLAKTWFDGRIFLAAVLSNAVTTVVGCLILDQEKIGGHLLNWIPVDQYHGSIRLDRTLFLFFSSFISTVIIEAAINLFAIKRFSKRQKLIGTLAVNIFTYIAGGLIILIYN